MYGTGRTDCVVFDDLKIRSLLYVVQAPVFFAPFV